MSRSCSSEMAGGRVLHVLEFLENFEGGTVKEAIAVK